MKKKILLVDDDTDILQMLAPLLTEEGFDVDTAQNASDFHRKALRSRPDLIILDIVLGEDQGPSVYDALLAEGFNREVPVIFLSGLEEEHSFGTVSPGRHFVLHSKFISTKDLLKDVYALLDSSREVSKAR
ncbi:MAG: response regulator [Candidatus Omnitrophota bacterium]|nr:response regulator [Candidatus Omnitrophota bacterium]